MGWLTDGRVAKPERRRDCRRDTPGRQGKGKSEVGNFTHTTPKKDNPG